MTSIAPTTPEEATALTFERLADRWFLFGAYGPRARFHMIAVWATLGAVGLLEAVWLALSGLRFAESNVQDMMRLAAFVALALAICTLISYRLAGADDRIGRLLRDGGQRVELFAVAAFAFGMLSAGIVTWCYLGSAAALPLQDARLSAIDRSLGFDWVGFVKLVNTSPLASWVLVHAYRSTPFMLGGTMLWFCFSGQADRLAEFLALSCLTFIGIAIGMMIWPAEGAYAYYNPPLSIYENIGVGSGMWHHDLLMAIRSGATKLIDFDTPNANCLVTFPSGHTVLAFIITYALRGSRWTLIPALMVNLAMLVSTIPHGGHHLVDLIGGGAIALCAIVIVRLPIGIRGSRPVEGRAVSLAGA
ncbi:MAG: phosphatase PAP2 family protein [Bradyrhizobium sp.]|nr:phosphatase PAP2 family protein [Bradyrhizobium sp.]